MIKKISGILGIAISIIGFSLYYPIAVETYPNVPDIWIKIVHYSLFVGLALTCLSIGINSEKRIRNLIHYTGFAFWFTIIGAKAHSSASLWVGSSLVTCLRILA